MAARLHMPFEAEPALGSSYHYARTQEELDGAIASLGPTVAVDSEFHWRTTYYPIASLYQLCSTAPAVVIDALAHLDIKQFVALLRSTEIKKVFHDVRQDWRLFTMLHESPLNHCEDTRVACAFLGGSSSLGYAAAVETHLGVTLEKSESNSDWLTRPLNLTQLQYAAEDVLYLPALWQHVSAALEAKGLSVCYREEMHSLVDDLEAYERDFYRRIPGATYLPIEQLRVLRSLSEWRECTAQEENRPRTWILKDKQLVDIAKTDSLSRKRLLHATSDSTAHRHGRGLMEAFWSGKNDELDIEPFSENPTSRHTIARIKEELDPYLKEIAGDLGIALNFLASSKMIAKCVTTYRCTSELPASIGTWRLRLFGDRMEEVVSRHTNNGGQEETQEDRIGDEIED